MNEKSTFTIEIDTLFQAGAHYGFSKSRRHPTAVPYLYGTKEGNDIFDLQQTIDQIAAAANVIEEYVKQDKIIMYVSTKDESKHIVRDAAMSLEAPHVVNRWIGGMLTNFTEIKKRVQRLNDLEAENASGALERKYTKKERVVLGREVERLRYNFGGIQNMNRRPDMLVIVDPRHDYIAVEEANTLGIPIVGILSSDCDVEDIDYPILMNDSLRGSVQLGLQTLAHAHKSGLTAGAAAEATPKQAVES
jgi:small subunit ribosomal protein S2